jgi:UPF0716 protein FxsA
MYRLIIVLLIVVPIVEIWGLITVGRIIGAWETFGVLLLSGLIGVYLAGREGKRVWALARLQLSQRQLPTQSILDGICILIGGLLLLIPGFLTDIIGILLIIPPTRSIFRIWLIVLIQNKFLRSGKRMITRR